MNPFEEIDRRLSNIEKLLAELCANNKPAEDVKEDLISAVDAARLMHISLSRLWVIHPQILKARKPGKKLLFSRTEVLDYIENREPLVKQRGEVRIMKTRKYNRA